MLRYRDVSQVTAGTTIANTASGCKGPEQTWEEQQVMDAFTPAIIQAKWINLQREITLARLISQINGEIDIGFRFTLQRRIHEAEAAVQSSRRRSLALRLGAAAHRFKALYLANTWELADVGARNLVSEKVPGITYRAEVYRLVHNSADDSDFAHLEGEYNYGQPIKTVRSNDEIEAASSVFQLTSIYAAPTSRVGQSSRMHHQAASDTDPEPLPPGYYEGGDPIQVRAKVGTTLRIQSEFIISAVRNVVKEQNELTFENGALVVAEPFCLLLRYMDRLEDHRSRTPSSTSTSPSTKNHVDLLLDYISSQYAQSLILEKNRYHLDIPTCTFEWSWMLFPPGCKVYTWDDGLLIACTVESCSLKGLFDFDGNIGGPKIRPGHLRTDRDLHLRDRLEAIELHIYYIEFDGEYFGRRYRTITIWPFHGERAILSLPAYPIEYGEDTLKSDMISRGAKYYDLMRPRHCFYEGLSLSTPRRRLSSRFVVDPATYYGNEEFGILRTPRLHLGEHFQHYTDNSDEDLFPNVESVRRYRKEIHSAYRRWKEPRTSTRTTAGTGSPLIISLEDDIKKDWPVDVFMLFAPRVHGFSLTENRWGMSLTSPSLVMLTDAQSSLR